MRNVIFVVLFLSGFVSGQICQINFAEIFAKYPNGAIAVYDLKNKVMLQYNPSECAKRYLPASTYKIPNSLIALETGVVKDEKEVFFRWSGKKYPFAAWERDHNLATAFRYSVVPFHIKVAKVVGVKTEQDFVEKFNYGNRKASSEIAFWIKGDIRISINEQIDFLKRLYWEKLPVSSRSIKIVKKIMIHERKQGYVLRGKTGWAMDRKVNSGWFVGYLEQNDNVYFFATHIISKQEKGFGKARIEITKRVLRSMGLLDSKKDAAN